MGYTIQAAGIILILSAVWLRAVRKMTTNLTAFWGIVGILLVTAKAVPSLSGRIEMLDAGGKQILCFFGAAVLIGGVIASLFFSQMAIKKQELSIQRSLQLQENELLEERDYG